jgi:hypothetical protein
MATAIPHIKKFTVGTGHFPGGVNHIRRSMKFHLMPALRLAIATS